MPPRNLPFPPMEAELVEELPADGAWRYEPKWDGFRGILENLNGELALWSRNARPLLRYFPELRDLAKLLPPRSALDGEIVIERDGVLDFDSMQLRLHPAESRIRKLSAEIPAEFIAFDVLLWNGEEVWRLPLEKRRQELETRAPGFRLSPTTRDADRAQEWLSSFESAGLDDRIATLLLGLYNDDGKIDYVGSAAVAASKHAQIAERVLPLLEGAPERGFSEPNRWGTGELEEAAVRPELVCEVRFDKVQGSRFRHGTRFLRFRDDKDPKQCTWREVRPPRRPGDPTFESLLAG